MDIQAQAQAQAQEQEQEQTAPQCFVTAFETEKESGLALALSYSKKLNPLTEACKNTNTNLDIKTYADRMNTSGSTSPEQTNSNSNSTSPSTADAAVGATVDFSKSEMTSSERKQQQQQQQKQQQKQKHQNSRYRLKTLGKRKFTQMFAVDTIPSPTRIPAESDTSATASTSNNTNNTNLNASTSPMSSNSSLSSTSDGSSSIKGSIQFIPGSVKYFWECSQCRCLPISARAKHSVIFHASDSNEPPSAANRPTMQYHFQYCLQALDDARKNGVIPTVENYDEEDHDDNDGGGKKGDAGRDREAYVGKSQLVKKKRGRPRKPKNANANANSNAKADKTASPKPKRQAKKTPNADTNTSTSASTNIRSPSTRREPRRRLSRSPAPRPSSPTTLKNTISPIPIPPTTNGLVHPTDPTTTTTIDMLIMSHMDIASYLLQEDKLSYKRQKPLDEGYPGLACKHCHKKWFFNSFKQLSTGFPKIEQHLMICDACPDNMRGDIIKAKSQEDAERVVLKEALGRKVTRRGYAQVVYERLRPESDDEEEEEE